MDILPSCINCGIAIGHRTERHIISLLRHDMSTLLSEWLGSELSPQTCICGACYASITRCLQNKNRERQLGHTSVCYGCGRSILNARKHLINKSKNIVLVVSSWQHYGQGNYLCHACYTRASREVARRNLIDNVREPKIELIIKEEEEEIPPEEKFEVPVPPPLSLTPPIKINVQDLSTPPIRINVQDSSTIELPNYKRCANTSRRCVFDGCQQNAGHLVPSIIKAMLLTNHKLFVPQSARVCGKHLVSNDWELLLENTSLCNSFTASQVEKLLDNRTKDFVPDFENVETMADHLCRYLTGRSTYEFMELYNRIPIQSVVPKKSKTALAILLIKYKTGDSDARISSLLRIPKSTLQHKMKLVKNCLSDEFIIDLK